MLQSGWIGIDLIRSQLPVFTFKPFTQIRFLSETQRSSLVFDLDSHRRKKGIILGLSSILSLTLLELPCLAAGHLFLYVGSAHPCPS